MPDGRTLLTRAIYDTQSIDLIYRDRVASFEFASLDYASPEKNRYAYKLEGLDRDWTELGNRRALMFTTLPAGRYTLRVKETNSDGLWNEEGAALLITREVAGEPPEKVIDHLFRRLDEWRGAAHQDDDVTAVLLQFKG